MNRTQGQAHRRNSLQGVKKEYMRRRRWTAWWESKKQGRWLEPPCVSPTGGYSDKKNLCDAVDVWLKERLWHFPQVGWLLCG